MPVAIVTQGKRGRSYNSFDTEHVEVASRAKPKWSPDYPTSTHPQYMIAAGYGMRRFSDLFAVRQMTALTTFSDLIAEVREKVAEDALRAGLPAETTKPKIFLADAIGF